MIGRNILHYTIVEKLGEGGMGVVYKALDTRLRRDVAIKFLPTKLAVHGEERKRFFHEAQAASALNHPNICTIHPIEEDGGETLIVMELVEGVTLRQWVQDRQDRIDKAGDFRKLPVRDVVNIAIQVGEGLEKAHDKGIVHRDIKSENVMVSADGRAKIMDFGLAKLQGVSKLTKAGSTIGTMAYMSPEQVEGIEADHRADIFSYGVVLYEAVSGRLPFQAAHEAAVMYEIMHAVPPALTALRPGIGEELERIVSKCLEKKPDERYQSIREVVVDLKRYKRDTTAESVSRPAEHSADGSGSAGHELPRRKPSRRGLVIGVAGAVIAAAAAVIIFIPSNNEAESGPKTLSRITSHPGLEMEPSLSPDGELVAYTTDERGNLDIVVKKLRGGETVRLVDSDADDAQPAFSPDGSKLAFVSARDQGGRLSIALGFGTLQNYVAGKYGDIFIVPATGGEPVKVASNGYYPAWSPDGKEITFQSPAKGSWDIWRVTVETGDIVQVTRDEEFDYHPSWSPDGRWIAYSSGTGGNFNLFVISPGGGEPRRLTDHTGQMIVRPCWSADGGSIVYSSNAGGSINLWKIPFSEPAESGFEEPVRVTVGEGHDVDAATARTARLLAYSTTKSDENVWEIAYPSGTKRRITMETTNEERPVESPDGSGIFIDSDRPGYISLWKIDRDGGIIRQVSPPDLEAYGARITPDGKWAVYSGHDESGRILMLQDLETDSVRTLVGPGVDELGGSVWSPDGRKIAYFRTLNQKQDIWIYSLETGENRRLTQLEFHCAFPAWSPDGREIAFQVQQGAVRTIWTMPASGGKPKQITLGTAEHSHPQWSSVHPGMILFVLDHKNLCRVGISTGTLHSLPISGKPILSSTTLHGRGTGNGFTLTSRERRAIFTRSKITERRT